MRDQFSSLVKDMIITLRMYIKYNGMISYVVLWIDFSQERVRGKLRTLETLREQRRQAQKRSRSTKDKLSNFSFLP
jgi:hypothetical protein